MQSNLKKFLMALFVGQNHDHLIGLDLLYLTGHKVKSVFAFKINFEKCQEKKGITRLSLNKRLLN